MQARYDVLWGRKSDAEAKNAELVSAADVDKACRHPDMVSTTKSGQDIVEAVQISSEKISGTRIGNVAHKDWKCRQDAQYAVVAAAPAHADTNCWPPDSTSSAHDPWPHSQASGLQASDADTFRTGHRRSGTTHLGTAQCA
eukprot:1095330-Amphidinium_carterae.1